MTKTSNKLILILGILAFIVGLLLTSPAYARTVRVDSGVTFNPYVQSTQYTNISQKQIPNTPKVIVGCDNRTTGFSIVTGQSCVGRSEEHTSELQSHSFISYAVFCLKKKKNI